MAYIFRVGFNPLYHGSIIARCKKMRQATDRFRRKGPGQWDVSVLCPKS